MKMSEKEMFDYIKTKADSLNFNFERNDVEIEYESYSIYGDDLFEVYENFKSFLDKQ